MLRAEAFLTHSFCKRTVCFVQRHLAKVRKLPPGSRDEEDIIQLAADHEEVCGCGCRWGWGWVGKPVDNLLRHSCSSVLMASVMRYASKKVDCHSSKAVCICDSPAGTQTYTHTHTQSHTHKKKHARTYTHIHKHVHAHTHTHARTQEETETHYERLERIRREALLAQQDQEMLAQRRLDKQVRECVFVQLCGQVQL